MSKTAISPTLAETATAPDNFRSYPPSFVDRLTDWVRSLSFPLWLFYLGVFVVLVLVYSGVKWADGSYPVGTFFPTHLLSSFTPIYALALLHYLDNAAKSSLDTFRGTMQISDSEYEMLRYRFTTMPVRPTLIAAIVGALYGVSNLLGSPQELEPYKLVTSALAIPFDVFSLGAGYAFAGVLIYHSVRQLRMMSRIYTDYAHVDLFNLGPMYSLSKLAGATAMGIGLIAYAWMFINVSAATQAGPTTLSIAEPIVSTVIMFFIFVLPLQGAHRLLQNAKAKAKNETSQHLKATIAEVHRRREEGQFDGMAGVNETIDALQKEHSILDKTSTWPWQPETLRGVGTAILLPILVWAITRVLENLVF